MVLHSLKNNFNSYFDNLLQYFVPFTILMPCSLEAGSIIAFFFFRSSRFWYLCLLRSFPLCLHFVTVTILRNHIFIWSVFAPKLVYEVTFTLLMFLITFISVFKRGTYYFVFNLCKYVQLGKWTCIIFPKMCKMKDFQ